MSQLNGTEFKAQLNCQKNYKEIAEKISKSKWGMELVNTQLVPLYTGCKGLKDTKIIAVSKGQVLMGLGPVFKEQPTTKTLKFLSDVLDRSILAEINVVTPGMTKPEKLTFILESTVTTGELFGTIWECIKNMESMGQPEFLFFGVEAKCKKVKNISKC